jgi:conjugal transfer/entry exclusion protein
MQVENSHNWTPIVGAIDTGGNTNARTPEQVRDQAAEADEMYELCREANGSLSARQLRRRLRGKRTNVTWER